MPLKKTMILSAAVIFGAALAGAVFAQTVNVGASASASAQTGATGASIGVQTQTQLNLRVQRAHQEIDRRVAALKALSARVDAMQRLSAAEKATITSQLQAQIDSLVTLKAKIDADADAVTLKTDVQSITGSYRIFALVLPRGYIWAASDRVQTIAANLNDVSAKFQARITAAQSSGQDVSAAASALADLNAKTSHANAEAQAAANLVAGLTPDQGNQAQASANHTALVQARAHIKTAMEDLQAARQDGVKIMQQLKISSTAGAQ